MKFSSEQKLKKKIILTTERKQRFINSATDLFSCSNNVTLEAVDVKMIIGGSNQLSSCWEGPSPPFRVGGEARRSETVGCQSLPVSWRVWASAVSCEKYTGKQMHHFFLNTVYLLIVGNIGADSTGATGNFAPVLTQEPGQTLRFAPVPFMAVL